MPFAIVGLFDPETEGRLQRLRYTLAEAGLCTAASAEARVHLTLALPDVADAEPLRNPVERCAAASGALPLHLAAVSTFPTDEGVVYIAPIVTTALLETHARLHALLREAGLETSASYDPERWVPHITIGYQLNPEGVARAVGLLRQADVFRTGALTHLAVAGYPPLRALYSYPLGPPRAAG